MFVCGCVCMCVLKNRETVFGLFFGFFFFSFPFPSLLGAQCQAGHGPCRLSSHCALRFQSSPRLIPGARRGISPRRSPGRCPPFSRRGGAAFPVGAGCGLGMQGWPQGGCPSLRPPVSEARYLVSREVEVARRLRCAPPAGPRTPQPCCVHRVIRGN